MAYVKILKYSLNVKLSTLINLNCILTPDPTFLSICSKLFCYIEIMILWDIDNLYKFSIYAGILF